MSITETKPLHEVACGVQSRSALVDFIQRLRLDLSNNSGDWENPTLDLFLGAMAAWIEDSDGYYIRTGAPKPSGIFWKQFADALMAAKIYE